MGPPKDTMRLIIRMNLYDYDKDDKDDEDDDDDGRDEDGDEKGMNSQTCSLCAVAPLLLHIHHKTCAVYIHFDTMHILNTMHKKRHLQVFFPQKKQLLHQCPNL